MWARWKWLTRPRTAVNPVMRSQAQVTHVRRTAAPEHTCGQTGDVIEAVGQRPGNKIQRAPINTTVYRRMWLDVLCHA